LNLERDVLEAIGRDVGKVLNLLIENKRSMKVRYTEAVGKWWETTIILIIG